MNKNGRLFLSMFKIGMIGFGGGTALIPVIERTVIDEYGLVTKEDYDVDVMVASITPGALPVEISAGVGRRIKGELWIIIWRYSYGSSRSNVNNFVYNINWKN